MFSVRCFLRFKHRTSNIEHRTLNSDLAPAGGRCYPGGRFPQYFTRSPAILFESQTWPFGPRRFQSCPGPWRNSSADTLRRWRQTRCRARTPPSLRWSNCMAKFLELRPNCSMFGKGVERAAREMAGEAHLLKGVHDEIAPERYCVAHFRRVRLRPCWIASSAASWLMMLAQSIEY